MSIDVKIRPGLVTDNKPHMVPTGSKLVSDEKMEAIVLAAVTGLSLTSRYSLPSTGRLVRSLDRGGHSLRGTPRRLHRRALRLEYFTVGWNVVEAVVAIGAGVIAGSVALIGFGADSAIEVISVCADLIQPLLLVTPAAQGVIDRGWRPRL